MDVLLPMSMYNNIIILYFCVYVPQWICGQHRHRIHVESSSEPELLPQSVHSTLPWVHWSGPEINDLSHVYSFAKAMADGVYRIQKICLLAC